MQYYCSYNGVLSLNVWLHLKNFRKNEVGNKTRNYKLCTLGHWCDIIGFYPLPLTANTSNSMYGSLLDFIGFFILCLILNCCTYENLSMDVVVVLTSVIVDSYCQCFALVMVCFK